MTSSPSVAPLSTARHDVARGAAFSLAGSVVSSIAGLGMILLLARLLDESGSGIVLQATGVAAIVMSLAKLGLDSAGTWLMPRLQADEQPVRPVSSYLVAVSVSSGVVAGLILIGVGAVFATGDGETATLGRALVAAGVGVPFGILMFVSLAVCRGLGDLRAFVSISNVGLPVGRPLLIALTVGFGGGAVSATVAWTVPLIVAGIAAWLWMRGLVGRSRASPATAMWPDGADRRRIIHFAVPRTLAAGLEQGLLWLDVIIVGAIAGSAEAGIYGAASRFVAAGMIADQALTLVVSPMFSAALHRGRREEVRDVYETATIWLVLFSLPIFAVLAVFAPVILSWLGDGFVDGSTALTILAVSAGATLAFGAVHTLLLMSGRSAWAAGNKVVVLTLNVVGNLVLVPRYGINGAAIAWSVSMVADAVLAAIQVRRFLGVHVTARAIGPVALASGGLATVAAVAVRWAMGPSTVSLVLAALLTVLVVAVWAMWARQRVHLDSLVGAFRPRV